MPFYRGEQAQCDDIELCWRKIDGCFFLHYTGPIELGLIDFFLSQRNYLCSRRSALFTFHFYYSFGSIFFNAANFGVFFQLYIAHSCPIANNRRREFCDNIDELIWYSRCSYGVNFIRHTGFWGGGVLWTFELRSILRSFFFSVKIISKGLAIGSDKTFRERWPRKLEMSLTLETWRQQLAKWVTIQIRTVQMNFHRPSRKCCLICGILIVSIGAMQIPDERKINPPM